MGRPLTGTVKAFGTKFRASCPTERGSRTRIEPTFLTERAAQTWRAAAPATLAGGGTVTLPSQGGACPAGGIWAWPGSTQRRAARRVRRVCRLRRHQLRGQRGGVGHRALHAGGKGGSGREASIRQIVATIDGYLTAHQLTLET